MSDYLTHLVARTLEQTDVVRPRPLARFEPGSVAFPSGEQAIDERSPAPAPSTIGLPPALSLPETASAGLRSTPAVTLQANPAPPGRHRPAAAAPAQTYPSSGSAALHSAPPTPPSPAAPAGLELREPGVVPEPAAPQRADARNSNVAGSGGQQQAASIFEPQPPARIEQVPGDVALSSPPERAPLELLLPAPAQAALAPAVEPLERPGTAQGERDAQHQDLRGTQQGETTVQITIGRIEVRVAQRSAAKGSRSSGGSRKPARSLDDYLRQRNGGGS